MSRTSDDHIPGPALAILIVITLAIAFWFHSVLSNECAEKGGHLKSVNYKTFVCVTDDGRIIE